MDDVLEAEVCLHSLNGGIVSARKDGVDVLNHGIDVCGAVCGHVLTDGLEVPPKVPAQLRQGKWVTMHVGNLTQWLERRRTRRNPHERRLVCYYSVCNEQ